MAITSPRESHMELAKIAGSRRISLNKLIDGGADMFAAQARNHHRDIAGNRASRPLVRNSLRVWVAS